MNAGQPNLHQVDWSAIPAPVDEGGARHLAGHALPDIELPATGGAPVNLRRLGGRVVVYVYPMTGRPGTPLPEGWDAIPGARGCTPQSCAFRDHAEELREAGATALFGLSVQDTAYQQEAARRLHLPFPLLSDAGRAFSQALSLPVMVAGGATLLQRLAWVADGGRITKVFYPVFPPDRNASDVLAWLRSNRS